ncbi:MAG: fructosamine kinase family protein [Chitinophagaceae bacterium]
MPIHQQFTHHLELCFSAFFKELITIQSLAPLTGSAISQPFLVNTSKGKFFMKRNAALFGLDFFEKEAKGLDMLANAGAMKVARPLFDGKYHQEIYVVMEFLEKGQPQPDFWENFGSSLAAQHQMTHTQYGLDYNNYIGKIPQSNHWHQQWSDFYAEERILKLTRRAVDHHLLDPGYASKAENLCGKLSSLIPVEKPALLHGDLWNGNFMVWQNGHVAIFDPAPYYGHREMDLAMSKLFGGFEPAFYEGYQQAFPLQPGFAEREKIHQLYPLLAHLLLFGGHYRKDVETILENFG